MSPKELSPENPTLTVGCGAQRILITVCLHGNEVCGMLAINELLNEQFFEEGFNRELITAKIVLGNPKAVQTNKRFIDVNLNRIFGKQFVNSNAKLFEHEPYECTLLPDIAEEISQCNYYIDIHSTSSTSPPFAIPAPDIRSHRMASQLPVDFLVEDLAKILPGTTMAWAHHLNVTQNKGIVASTVECGQHRARCTIDTAKQVIKNLFHVAEQSDDPSILHDAGSCPQKPQMLSCKLYHELKEGFHFVRPVKGFQRVAYNELIAVDDMGEIRCPFTDGAHLIMPTNYPVIGEEAWFWGEVVDDNDRERELSSSGTKSLDELEAENKPIEPQQHSRLSGEDEDPTRILDFSSKIRALQAVLPSVPQSPCHQKERREPTTCLREHNAANLLKQSSPLQTQLKH